MKIQRPLGLLVIFVLCLFTFSAIDGFSFFTTSSFLFARVDSAHYFLKALLYVFTYTLVVFAFVCAITHRSAVVRTVSCLYLFVCLSVQLSLLFSKGHVFSLNEAFLFVDNTSFFGGAMQQYFSGILLGTVVSIAFVVGLAYTIHVLRVGTRSRHLLFSPMAISLALLVVYWSDGRISTSPIVSQLPVSLYFAYDHKLPFDGVRDDPFIAPTNNALIKHIVLIVDESVRGDLLSINRSESLATPFLESISHRLLNWGIACSPSNYSAASNIIIQSGLRQDQLPDHDLRALKNPNIFSYMRKAGYRTYLVNNQIHTEIPDNMVSTHDIAALDGYVVPRLTRSIHLDYEIDIHSIDSITSILESEEPSFTYVIKYGAHFPYQRAYPHDTQSVFVPAIEDNAELRVDKERTRNSYLNAVHWNVDVFFERLVAKLDGRDVLIVYTSDHGQSLLESANEHPSVGHSTGKNPSILEAVVPLAFLPLSAKLKEKLDPLFNKRNVDKVSGFEIFPSLLYLAGYAKSDIADLYGKTMFDEHPQDDRAFLSGHIFGLGESWMNPCDIGKIDVDGSL